MNLIHQKTLKKSLSFEGIGLHSGKKSKVNIRPALPNHGVVFKRVDLSKDNLITAHYTNVHETFLCTKLKNSSNVKVSTVEHLLAALYISGVDNALIEIDNEEVPMMDGSAKDFIEPINGAGLEIQNEKIKYLFITKKFEFRDQNKQILINPSDNLFEVNFKLNYENKIIGCQENTVNLFNNNKLEDIYSSRTFCLLADVEKIKAMGLAQGGSLDNAIVVDDEKVMNKSGLRYHLEFVNHKILDLCGDFYLSGYRILGNVRCTHGGHQLSCEFIKQLMNEKSSYKIDILEKKTDKKIIFTNSERFLATA